VVGNYLPLSSRRLVKSAWRSEQEVAMKNVIAASVMSLTLGLVSLMAQEKKDMPMKEGMPMKGEGMQGSGMMMGKMKEMQGTMSEMRKGMGGDEGPKHDEE
jgi:hypothetical protein